MLSNLYSAVIVLYLLSDYWSKNCWQWPVVCILEYADRPLTWAKLLFLTGLRETPQAESNRQTTTGSLKLRKHTTRLSQISHFQHVASFLTKWINFRDLLVDQSFNWLKLNRELIKRKSNRVDFFQVHFLIIVPWQVVFLGTGELYEWLPATFFRVRKPVIWGQVFSWYTGHKHMYDHDMFL